MLTRAGKGYDMRIASRFAGLVTMATIAVSGMAVSAASAGTGSLELLSDTWADASASADGSRIAFTSSVDGQVYVRDVATGGTRLVSTSDGTDEGERLREHPGAEDLAQRPVYVPDLCAQPRPAGYGHPLRHLPQGDLSTGALTVVSTTSAGAKGNLPSSTVRRRMSDTGTVVFGSQALNFPPVAPLPERLLSR